MNLLKNISKKIVVALLIIHFQVQATEIADHIVLQEENMQNSCKLIELASAHIFHLT